MDFNGVDLEHITALGFEFLVNLLLAALIFLIGKWVAKRIVRLIEVVMGRSHVDKTLIGFVSNVLYGLMLAVIIITALSKLGVNTTSAVAILGGAALAVGMALKDQLSSFAAGVMIIVFRPFKVGDFVEIDGIMGTVQQIKIVFTELLTSDNQRIVIPNGNITTNAIKNFSAEATRRITLPIGVGYGADIKQTREIMLGLANAEERVLKEPAARVGVTSLGDNAVELTLYCWTKTPDWFVTGQDLTESIKIALDDAGIDIPFPQRTLHVQGLEHLVAADKE